MNRNCKTSAMKLEPWACSYYRSLPGGLTNSSYRLITNFLSVEVSRMRSEIRQVGTNIHNVQQALEKTSPHDISEPVFFIRDPLGRPITIQLSFCDGFQVCSAYLCRPGLMSWQDLDRLLRAYLFNRPDAGSRYVERGDYSIVSTDGFIIPRWMLRWELRAGIVFDMSIIQRRRMPPTQDCPHCDHINEDGIEGTWVNW